MKSVTNFLIIPFSQVTEHCLEHPGSQHLRFSVVASLEMHLRMNPVSRTWLRCMGFSHYLLQDTPTRMVKQISQGTVEGSARPYPACLPLAQWYSSSQAETCGIFWGHISSECPLYWGWDKITISAMVMLCSPEGEGALSPQRMPAACGFTQGNAVAGYFSNVCEV